MKSSSYNATRQGRTQLRGVAAEGGACGDRCAVELVHADSVAVARRAIPSPAECERAVELFAALANPTRVAILAALQACATTAKPELCVCDLEAVTKASQSMTSHQLSLLREAGLVTARREGRLMFYRLVEGPAARLLEDALSLARGARR